MARLIVEAVSEEFKSVDRLFHLSVFISVSRADDGTSVTGLELDNFNLCSPIGGVLEMELLGGFEAKWETNDVDLAGCYSMSITRKSISNQSNLQQWFKGEFYPFGIQVKMTEDKTGIVHMGQTVLRIKSLGN